jgi:acetyl-CoA acetyltransferase
MEDIVIVSPSAPPSAKFGGSLAKIPATELGAIVIKEALARAKIDPRRSAKSSWARCSRRAPARIRRARRC